MADLRWLSKMADLSWLSQMADLRWMNDLWWFIQDGWSKMANPIWLIKDGWSKMDDPRWMIQDGWSKMGIQDGWSIVNPRFSIQVSKLEMSQKKKSEVET